MRKRYTQTAYEIYNKYVVLKDPNDVELVVKFMIKALKFDSEFVPAMLHLGHIYDSCSEFRKAYYLYLRAQEIEPDNPLVYRDLGDCVLGYAQTLQHDISLTEKEECEWEVKHHRKALSLFCEKKYIEIYNYDYEWERWDIYSSLILNFKKLGKYSEAEELIIEAAEKLPNDKEEFLKDIPEIRRDRMKAENVSK